LLHFRLPEKNAQKQATENNGLIPMVWCFHTLAGNISFEIGFCFTFLKQFLNLK